MEQYRITLVEEFDTIMVKNTEQMKAWIKKYGITTHKGDKVDLRKARGGIVVNVNGKLLRVRS